MKTLAGYQPFAPTPSIDSLAKVSTEKFRRLDFNTIYHYQTGLSWGSLSSIALWNPVQRTGMPILLA